MIAAVALCLAAVAFALAMAGNLRHDQRLRALERNVAQIQLRKRINVDLVKHRARFAKPRVNSS